MISSHLSCCSAKTLIPKCNHYLTFHSLVYNKALSRACTGLGVWTQQWQWNPVWNMDTPLFREKILKRKKRMNGLRKGEKWPQGLQHRALAYSTTIFLVHTKEKGFQTFWGVKRISRSLFHPRPAQAAATRLRTGLQWTRVHKKHPKLNMRCPVARGQTCTWRESPFTVCSASHCSTVLVTNESCRPACLAFPLQSMGSRCLFSSWEIIGSCYKHSAS